jgi:hypothetical protein
MQTFEAAGEGIRTLDVLHGKQNVRRGRLPRGPCKEYLDHAEAVETGGPWKDAMPGGECEGRRTPPDRGSPAESG